MTAEKTEAPPLTEIKAEGELCEKDLERVSGGSQSSGAGAGKVTFNPFSITRKIDSASP